MIELNDGIHVIYNNDWSFVLWGEGYKYDRREGIRMSIYMEQKSQFSLSIIVLSLKTMSE